MLDRAAGMDTKGRVCHSAELLAVLQGGFGLGKDFLWLGYQICLDLGAIQPAWFDAATIAVLGPGALDWLGRIFKSFPYQVRGMLRSSTAARCGVPFLVKLTELLSTSQEATFLREVLLQTGLPLPHVNDVEYWLCELRQAEDAPPYSGSGRADAEYAEGLQKILVNGHLAGYV